MPELSLNLESLVQDNIVLLNQVDALLSSLDDARYTNNSSVLFDSALGVHVRHLLDHYDCLLQGLQRGCVNYDARERDARVESGTAYARQRLHRL
ncbi:MAG: hypothetical protein HKO07_05205, partial [Pseudomonadales bacterium]|nr:hypothetical protein [Pseudomonadales bacterium]